MDEDALRGRLATAPVARLATVGPDGAPHLVPVCFAPVRESIVTAVDAKPKSTSRLRRLDHVRREPRVTLLVDHYEDDWGRLWWVRVDGLAHVTASGPVYEEGITALVARYHQYRDRPPAGPLIAVEPTRWTGWSAS